MQKSRELRQEGQAASEPWVITVPSAAAKLSISRSKAYSLIKQGILPAIFVGHSIRVPVQELARFIESQLTNDK